MSLIQSQAGCFDFNFEDGGSHLHIIAEEGSPFYGDLLWRDENRKPKPMDVVWTAPEDCWSGNTQRRLVNAHRIQKEIILAVEPQNPKTIYYCLSEEDARKMPRKHFQIIRKVVFSQKLDFFQDIWTKSAEWLEGEDPYSRADWLVSLGGGLPPFKVSTKVFKLGKSGACWGDGGLILGECLGEASSFYKLPRRN